MSGSLPDPVSPSLSGLPGEGDSEGRLLLVGQCPVGPAVGDRLGVHARAGSRVQAAQNEAVAGGIGEGHRETLVPPGVLERVEADQPDALDRSPSGGLEERGSGRQLVELARDRKDLVEVGIEDGPEVGIVGAAGQAVQPTPQATDPARLGEGQEEQDEGRQRERDQGGSDDRLDQGVEIDRAVPPDGSAATGCAGRAESSRVLEPILTAGTRPMLSSGPTHDPLGVRTNRWPSAPDSPPDRASDDRSSVPADPIPTPSARPAR